MPLSEYGSNPPHLRSQAWSLPHVGRVAFENTQYSGKMPQTIQESADVPRWEQVGDSSKSIIRIMARPNSYGIVALHDDREDNLGFFCMRLAKYISDEIPIGDNLYGSLWRIRFVQAKAGKCAYRENCPTYAKSKPPF